jgi:hypothetical protein
MPFTADQIAASLDTAPAWAKIGLTMRSERLREDALRELAQHVHTSLYEPPRRDEGQLALPL